MNPVEPTTILLCSDSGQFGGMEIRMLQEARHLRDIGWRPQVVVPAEPGLQRMTDALACDRIPYDNYRAPKVLSDWRYRHVHWARAQLPGQPRLAASHPVLAHVFFPWTNQGLDLLWVAARANIPTIVSVHNVFPNRSFAPWHQRHLPRAFQSLRGVYGVTRDALESFELLFERFWPPNVRRAVIYNSVDLDRFRPCADRRARIRWELGIPGDAPVVGSVGRLDVQKQPLRVLAAFETVLAYAPETRLVLVGDGPLRADVEAAVTSKGLNDKVRRQPFRADVESVFTAFDVHLLMSEREGFGLVTAEALACGVPVVATQIPGTQEVVAGCVAARLVQVGDVAAAASATAGFLSADKTSRLETRKAARCHVKQRFSDTAWKTQIAQFYTAMLSAPDVAPERD